MSKNGFNICKGCRYLKICVNSCKLRPFKDLQQYPVKLEISQGIEILDVGTKLKFLKFTGFQIRCNLRLIIVF